MSISTRIPTGTIHRVDWCYGPLYDPYNGTVPTSDSTPPSFFSCANRKTNKGKPAVLKDSDFQAFCCDGKITGWYSLTNLGRPQPKDEILFEDLTCCHSPSVRSMEEPDQATTCDAEASATPLASLAGTGTAEAQPYEVTYASEGSPLTEWVVVQGGSTLTEMVVREAPSCFWVDTVHGVSMTSVEVPRAEVTTLPPMTTDGLIASPKNVSTSEGSSRNGETSGTAAPTKSGTAGADSKSTSSMLRVPKVVCVGLLLISWMVSM